MNAERGYTVAELMVATFIFGLMISFLIPIFQEIQADAREQTATLESTQFMQAQIERLTGVCVNTNNGFVSIKGNQDQIKYQLKWRCQKLSESMIKIHVEVQWKDKQGKLKNREIETHRYIPNKDLPT